MQPTLEHLSMSELEAHYARLKMMPDQLPYTYDSEISKTLQAIIKLRAKEFKLHEHQERCPMLSMSHEDSSIQMYDEYNMELDTEYMPANIPEEEYFASKARCKHTAFMTTPVKRLKGTRDYDSPEDSRNSDGTPQSEPSDTRSEDSEAKSESSSQSINCWQWIDRELRRIGRGRELEASITSSQDEESEDSQQDTSGSSFEDNSCELQEEEPERPHHRIYRKESKKRKFVFPKRPKEERSAAGARIQAALEQVPNSVHLNSRGKRDTATLYVGNIDYNASEQDLSNALDPIFKRIRVEKVTIPRVNGRSMYGFIEISWARKAPVKASDLCIHWSSGRVTVNGRPIYFRESCGKEDSE